MDKLKIRLRELRAERKLTQGQIAQRLGVHRSYIARIEQGDRVPALEIAYRLARVLGCRMDDLINTESHNVTET